MNNKWIIWNKIKTKNKKNEKIEKYKIINSHRCEEGGALTPLNMKQEVWYIALRSSSS